MPCFDARGDKQILLPETSLSRYLCLSGHHSAKNIDSSESRPRLYRFGSIPAKVLI